MKSRNTTQSTIDSEGFKGGTRGAPIMPRDAVSRTAHVGTVGTNGLIVNFFEHLQRKHFQIRFISGYKIMIGKFLP